MDTPRLRKVAVDFRRLMLRIMNQAPRPTVWMELDPDRERIWFCMKKERFALSVVDMTTLLDLGAEKVMQILPPQEDH